MGSGFNQAHKQRSLAELATAWDAHADGGSYAFNDWHAAMACAYIADHPPTQFSLRPFGHTFADWLGAAWPDDPDEDRSIRPR